MDSKLCAKITKKDRKIIKLGVPLSSSEDQRKALEDGLQNKSDEVAEMKTTFQAQIQQKDHIIEGKNGEIVGLKDAVSSSKVQRKALKKLLRWMPHFILRYNRRMIL